MSGTDSKALLARLKALPEGTTFADILAELESSQPKGMIEARRHCALVRGFDEELYILLVKNVFDAPPLDQFVKSRDVRQVGAERWALEERTRARLLEVWHGPSQLAEWRDWNSRIAHYLVRRARPEDRLDAIHHFSLSAAPEEGVELFRRWYAEADGAFDLAQCYALLETLRVQSETRGEALSNEWREHDRYYRARMQFIHDYYKSGAYFERAGPLDAFEDILLRGEHKRWILHIHATGGTGKTMFQRWLISRYLVPRRIPCARLDFDDFDLARATEYPVQLFARIFQAWAGQVPGDKLSSLVLNLKHEESIKGWNRGVLAEVRRSLLGAQLDIPLVVVLDTLEDVTLTKQAWLRDCVQALRSLHDVYPKLLVVLSGRYNIVQHCDALVEGEYVMHELSRFSESEAHRYLAKRGIREGKTRDAIVARTAGGEGDDSDELQGRNPFKLALFAEFALSRSTLTPEDVWAFPRVDVAYLIERVIKRIKAQPLRWAIRYGAISRHLTKQFIEAVLLPPLRQALRGAVADQPASHWAKGYPDVWLAEPDSVERIDAQQLWTDLAQYSRDRGWITLVGTGEDAELRFHPDVVVPTRKLLQQQDIHSELQQLAVSYYERGVAAAQSLKPQFQDMRIASTVKNLCEAVFHQFQWQGAAARDYWISSVRYAEQYGPAAAARVASEITGRDYANQQREPLSHVITGQVLAEAHCETADLLMQAAGAHLGPIHPRFPEFMQRVELAHAIERADNSTYVPRLLRALREALLAASAEESITLLEGALKEETTSRERFFLCLQLARVLRMTAPREAFQRYEEAFVILPSIDRAGVDAFDLAMLLAEVNREIGADEQVRRWFARSRELAFANPRRLAKVAYVESKDALGVDDLQTASLRIDELARLPASEHPKVIALPLLKARLALASYDAPEVLRLIAAAKELSLTDLHRAQLWDQEGEAHALRLEFNAAFEAWDSAASCYDAAQVQTGSARCALLAARLKATSCGDMLDALSMIEGASQLRGMQDSELSVEFGLLRCYALYRRRLLEPARTIFGELMSVDRSTWPAALHAKARVFGLIFALVEPTPSYIEELLHAIEQVHPVSLRPSLLEWCAHSDLTLSLHPETLAQLRDLFAARLPDPTHPRQYLNQAELYRILGDRDKAARMLSVGETSAARVSPWARVFELWQIQCSMRRLGRRTDFGSVLRQAEEAGLQHEPLLDAIRIEAAFEAARADRRTVAERLVDSGFINLLQQGRSIWHGRVLELQAEIVNEEHKAEQLREASALYVGLGDVVRAHALSVENTAQSQLTGAGASPPSASASAVPDPEIVLIDITQSKPTLVSQLARAASSHEIIIDRLLGDWTRFAGDLSELLRNAHRSAVCPKAAALRLPTSLQSLPWEIATALADCELVWRAGAESKAFVPQTTDQLPRVLLLRPEGDSEISLEASSGASIDYMYRAAGVEVVSLHNPQPSEVLEILQSWRPALLHINASMVESGHGSYLDFTGKRARANRLFQQKTSEDAHRFALEWSAQRLARMLEGTNCTPVVALDLSNEENQVEAVRGLLLRNSYCAQLARYAQCRAVIGAGLATPWERLTLTHLLVQSLVGKTVAQAVTELRHASYPNGGLESVLPRRGVALWARDPHIRAVEVSM